MDPTAWKLSKQGPIAGSNRHVDVYLLPDYYAVDVIPSRTDIVDRPRGVVAAALRLFRARVAVRPAVIDKHSRSAVASRLERICGTSLFC